MSMKIFAFSCGLCFFISLNDIPAVEIFDTTSSSPVNTGTFSNQLWAATQFRTTVSDFVLTSLSFNAGAAASGNLVLKVYSENAGKPGTQVGANLGSIDVSTISGSISLSGLNVPLSPSTNYWLVIDNDAMVSGQLELAFSTSATGIGSPFSFAQGTGGANWSTFPGYALIGTITAVPEPGTIWMVTACLGVLSAVCFRRMKKLAAS